MKKVLAAAAVGEIAIGLVLLAYPAIVVRLLFGGEIVGAGVVMSRIAGISLIALGLACMPLRSPAASVAETLQGMLSYSLVVTLYLGYLGIGGEWVGILLWPAVVVHAAVTIYFTWVWFARTSASQ